MKVITLVALAICAFAHASTATRDERVLDDSVKADILPQVIAEEEQRLSQDIAAGERSGRSLVANAIAKFLEDFRDVVINGNDVLPPLDPLHIEHIGPFAHSSTGVRIQANINDFNVEGLRWYVVDHVTFYSLRLALGAKVTVPWITFTGNYDASARILLVSHNAGGNYRVFINRLEVSVDLRVGTNLFGGGTLILRDLNIGIVIHDVTVQISGMVGSSTLNNLINSLVQSAAQNLLVDQMDEISKMLSQELFDAVNEFLGKFTLEDLLG